MKEPVIEVTLNVTSLNFLIRVIKIAKLSIEKKESSSTLKPCYCSMLPYVDKILSVLEKSLQKAIAIDIKTEDLPPELRYRITRAESKKECI